MPFGVLAGWRIEEIAAVLPTSGLDITPDEFLAAARAHPQGYTFSDGLPDAATFEGFLFPDVYTMPRTITAPELVATLAGRFETQLPADILQGFAKQGLSTFQAVTLASLVEREAVLDDEMPTIASVFLNRLNSQMKLDSDPTVQYALGFNAAQNTWWTNPVPDTGIDSPFKTYLHAADQQPGPGRPARRGFPRPNGLLLLPRRLRWLRSPCVCADVRAAEGQCLSVNPYPLFPYPLFNEHRHQLFPSRRGTGF